MKNICRYIAVVMAFVMTLMMVSCGTDKGTDVAQNTKSKATNSKNTSSAVSSEAVSSVAASSEEASSVAVSSEAASSKAPVVSKAPVSSKTPTVSKAPVASKEPVASTAPAVSSSAPVNTGNTTGWVCPDPGAHGDKAEANGFCTSAEKHASLVENYEEEVAYMQWLKENPETGYPEGQNNTTWCIHCNRPLGNGYNGTCKRYFCNETWHCHHYDTGDTCQIPH